MKIYFNILLLLVLPSFLFAQSTFLKVYGGNDHEIGNIGFSDGTSHLIGGYSLSYSNATPVGTLIKTDLQGNQIWSKTYAPTFGSILSYGFVESNGDYVISGLSYGSSGATDGLIMRINSQGVVQWSRKTGFNTANDRMSRILKASNGDYLVGGMTTSQTVGGMRDFVVSKVNPNNGAPIWSRVWGGGQNDWLMNFMENSSGFLIGGNTFTYGSGQHDFMVTQLSNNGVIAWSKVYGTSNEEQMWNIAKVSNTMNVISGFQTVSGIRRLFAIAIDNNGNQIWSKTYSLANTNLSGRCFLASNGDLLMSAYEPTNSSNSNIHILRIDSGTGNVIWAREYVYPGFDAVNLLEEKTNGNIVVYGYSSSAGAGQRDLLLMEVSSTGMMPNCNVSTITSNINTNNLSVTIQNITPSNGTTVNNVSSVLNTNNVTATTTTVCNDGVTADFSMNNTSICVGDCINLTDLSTNATQWQWSFIGGNPLSSTSQNVNQVCYNTAGTYDIQLIASDGTSSDTIIKVTIYHPVKKRQF